MNQTPLRCVTQPVFAATRVKKRVKPPLTAAARRTYSPAVMDAFRVVFPLITAVLVSRCALLMAAEPPTKIGPQEAVVLLTNGEILRGKVSRAGDHFFVWVPDGEIRLPAKRVQRLCDTLDEAYVYLSRSGTGSVDAHLELAAWCLRLDLFGYAANELRAAMAQEPDNPRISILARRLEIARGRPAANSPRAASAVTKIGSADVEKAEPAFVALPEGAFAVFTSRLQPLLMNKCAGVGCHGTPTEAAFRLSRMKSGRNPTRRQTRRNLAEVLRWIDTEQPANSPLLQKPLEASHGGMVEPVFTAAKRSQYERLVEFVKLAVQEPTPIKEEEHFGFHFDDARTGTLPSEMRRPQPNGDKTEDRGEDAPPVQEDSAASPTVRSLDRSDSSDLSNSPTTSGDDEPEDGALLNALEPSHVQRGAIVERFVPVDEFDPSIFNRRYFHEKQPPPPVRSPRESPTKE